jgi:hypothetical protein
LSTRELAAHIVRNTDPWCDADAIRVAQAYIDAYDFLDKLFTSCYVDTPEGTDLFIIDGDVTINEHERALVDHIFAAGPPDDPADA